jgi:hypothetical protein
MIEKKKLSGKYRNTCIRNSVPYLERASYFVDLKESIMQQGQRVHLPW